MLNKIGYNLGSISRGQKWMTGNAYKQEVSLENALGKQVINTGEKKSTDKTFSHLSSSRLFRKKNPQEGQEKSNSIINILCTVTPRKVKTPIICDATLLLRVHAKLMLIGGPVAGNVH